MRWAIGRLRHEEGARDLVGGQAAEQAQRERDARLGRQHRMAGGEHEAQQVVADVVVERGVEVGPRPPARLRARGRAPRACARASLFAAQPVDRAVLGGGHEPGARVVRDARLRPLLERGDERVLRQLLGQADVAHDAREAGDQPGRLDPPDRVDRAMGVGSRHCDRSDQSSTAGGTDAAHQRLRAARRAALAGAPPAPELGRELGAEVLGLEHLADLDLGRPRRWDWGSA